MTALAHAIRSAGAPVTNGELQELVEDCPVLYHMAARGSWPSIQEHGLLSTTALLDLFEIAGEAREAIESQRRREMAILVHPAFGKAVIRDQKPMDDRALQRCLSDGLTPRDWYELLNGRVFFWLTRSRLHRLLSAGPYRDDEHDVLELDTASVVRDYRDRITLAPINTGSTRRRPAVRGRTTIAGIDAYPYAEWRVRRSRGERVVELAVAPGIPDAIRYTRRVVAMQAGEEKQVLWQNPAFG
ncbi:DUF7002 family protein [Consotaella aegiceratis]|uniref:DUF7002 family protein n=1 Tax=Consotaella aegiceratis TaxID=3097961 RepID=UPI002F40CF4C